MGILVAAPRSWSCVPQPLISLQPSASGPSGTAVSVEAQAIDGPAEVRWNGVDGPLLARGTGPTFSAPISVPDTSPGLYTVILIERKADGGVGSSARASFLVTEREGPEAVEPRADGPSDNDAALAGSRPGTSSTPGGTAVLLTACAVLFGVGALAGAKFSRRKSRR